MAAKRKGTSSMCSLSTRGRAAGAALALVAVLSASLGAAAASAHRSASLSPITVFAGSSMASVLPAVYAGNTYSFGSRGTLATQITNGAPADVLMGANTTTCASLYAQGIAERPVDFTRNTLERVVPKSNPAGIPSVYAL